MSAPSLGQERWIEKTGRSAFFFFFFFFFFFNFSISTPVPSLKT
jgi:hypothetical protein